MPAPAGGPPPGSLEAERLFPLPAQADDRRRFHVVTLFMSLPNVNIVTAPNLAITTPAGLLQEILDIVNASGPRPSAANLRKQLKQQQAGEKSRNGVFQNRVGLGGRRWGAAMVSTGRVNP